MKIRLNRVYIFIVLFFVIENMVAQQDPNYTFYRYTMNIVNPAYAGAEDRTEFMADIRSQWAGIEGAPETQSFIASTHLGKKVGLGVSVVNDKTFIETQTSIAVDFSYLVRWNDNTNIYLGIKASGNSYNANTAGLMTFGIGSDPSLTDIDGGITPNVGAGIYVKNSKLSLAFSAPKILKPKRLEEDEGTAKMGRNKLHMYLMGAYDFEIARNLVFKPSTLIRHIESAPLSVDFTLALKFNNIIEFGTAYRLDEGFAGFALFSPTDNLFIGYAYDAPLHSSLRNINNGTHEILLKVSL